MKWIPVGNQEPNLDQDVLIVAYNLESLPNVPHFWDNFISLARYKGTGNFALRDYMHPHDIKITHWMKLPKMPNDGHSKIKKTLLRLLQ